MGKSVVIVLAGGSGNRMQHDGNKVYVEVDGAPLLTYSLMAFNRSPDVDRMVLVVRKGEFDAGANAVQMALADKTMAIVEGGADRQASERAGLDAVRTLIVQGAVDVVAIHDGARPFVSQGMITEIMATAREVGGAVPGLPVLEPLFEITAKGPPQPVAGELVRMQTPQAFRAASLLAAYDAAAAIGGFSAVDTAETMERFGHEVVAVVAGDENNIKVTYPDDLADATVLARRRRWLID